MPMHGFLTKLCLGNDYRNSILMRCQLPRSGTSYQVPIRMTCHFAWKPEVALQNDHCSFSGHVDSSILEFGTLHDEIKIDLVTLILLSLFYMFL